MLLALDVGNTHSVVGLFDGEALVSHWRLTTRRDQTSDEAWVLLDTLIQRAGVRPDQVTAMAVSSVVPGITQEFALAGKRLMGEPPLVIDHAAVPDFKILNHDPATVGPDRIVNSIAARARYGTPVIVVDLGTATTLDVVDAEGAYAGGIICPGVQIGAEALFRRGARLGQVELKVPERVVGRSTEESLQSGIVLGAVGTIEYLVKAVNREMGFDPSCPVVATGGLAPALGAATRAIQHVDPELTLHGIRLIWEES